MFAFAVARCHENDPYVKEIGRIKSAGRLCSPKFRNNFHGSKQELMEYLYTMPINIIGN